MGGASWSWCLWVGGASLSCCQLSQLDQLTELHLHVGDDGGQLGALDLFRAGRLTLLDSRRAGGGGGGVCVW